MTDYRVTKGEAQEDQITASIEKFTSQVPASAYLAAALAYLMIHQADHGSLPPDNEKNPPINLGRLSPA